MIRVNQPCEGAKEGDSYGVGLTIPTLLRNGDTHEHTIFSPSSLHNPVHTFLGRQTCFLDKASYNLLGPFPFLVTDRLLMVFVKHFPVTHPSTGPSFPKSMSEGLRLSVCHVTVTTGMAIFERRSGQIFDQENVIDNGFTRKRGNVLFGKFDSLGVVVKGNDFAGRIGMSYSS